MKPSSSLRHIIFQVAALAAASPAAAAIHTATQASFNTVFSTAQAGDTIVLQGAFNDEIRIRNRHFSTAVTIDATSATINRTLRINTSSGIAITGGQWNHNATYGQMVTIKDSTDIKLARANFTGTSATISSALGVVQSSGISISDNKFTNVRTSIVITSTTDSLVTRNRILGATSDGIDVADSHRILVSSNYCGGTVPHSTAHPDCVQLWSLAGMPVQSDIVILNNVAEGATQGFTSFDPEPFSGQRIVFAGNLTKLSFPHSISCYGCQDSLFLDNTVIAMPGTTWKTLVREPYGVNNTFINNQVFDYRNRTLEDVLAITHKFSTYRPDFVPGASTDIRTFSTAVPDPGVWMQLLAGFSLIGLATRRRKAPSFTKSVLQ